MAVEAELASQSEVYSPSSKTPLIIIWRALMNLLSFVFQVLLRMLKVTSSITHLLSSSPRPLLATSSFEPLPTVELTEHVSSSTTNVDHHRCIQRLKIVLDLDETLVCAYEASSLPAVLRKQATEGGLKWFDLECLSSDKEYDGKPKVNHVTVFERPGLHEFLKQIGEFADLVLFTAGLEGYAGPLVDRIDVGNQFGLRLYRPSTISTEYRDHVKDLSCISEDLQRTVIVDNNPFSFLLQPLNGIPCVPFSAGQPHDEQLLKVILPLLKHLSLQKDVRPVLYDRFHMPEWFQKHGIPVNRKS